MFTSRTALISVILVAFAPIPTASAAPFVVATGPSGAPWVAGSLVRERQPGLIDPGDVLLVRADLRGTEIASSLWIGGSGRDLVHAIGVDASGSLWIAGSTDSPDFPLPVDPSRAGVPIEDAFVVKLSPDGSRVLAAWRSGRSAGTVVHALAVGPGDQVVIAGGSIAPESAGAFVARFDPDGRLASERFVSTVEGDDAFDVSFDGADGVTIAGSSAVTGGFVTRWSPGLDAMIWREDTAAHGIARLTRLGRGADGAVLAMGDDRRLLRVDPGSGVAAPAVGRDLASDAVLRVLSGAVAIDRLDGRRIVDAAAAPDGTLWAVGESATGLPQGAVAVAEAAPGVQVFLTRDPLAPAAVCPGSTNFDNSAGTGAWETASNWDTNVLPGATDDVCINGFTVTLSSGTESIRSLSAGATGTFVLTGGSLALSQDAALNAFTHSAGTLSAAGTITVGGAYVWSGGTLAGAGTTTALSGMTLSGGPTLDGRRLINPAGQTFTYATVNGGLNFSNGAVLQNDGTFDSQADNALQWTGSGAIGALENSGTYRKSGGTTGVSTLSITVTNTGAIQAQTGTLQWNRNLTSTGTVTAASGATLLFADGTHSLNPAPTVPAGATLRVDGQSVTFGSGYNPAGTTRLNGGTFALNGSPNVLANLTHTSGALTGSADITVSGAWSWSGGQLQQTAAGTTATALSGMTLSGGPTLDGRRLINPAGQTITYATVNGGLNFSNGAVLQNDGTFDSQADNALQWTGSGAIGALENSGTYRKSGGTTGVSTLSITVTNTGAIQAQTGTLQWNRNLTSTGTVTAASGATLLFADGTHSLNPAPTVPAGATLRVDGQSVTFGSGYNPAGTTRLNGGTFALNGSPNVLANLTHTSGALTGSADITVSGAWSWSGGQLQQTAAGTTATALSGMTLSGGPTLDGRRLINPAGQTFTYATVNGGLNFSNGAVLQNDGTFDSQADNALQWTGSGAIGALENSGTYRKSGGTTGVSTLSITVTNTGAIQAQTGTLQWNRNLTSTGTVTAASGATLLFADGTHSLNPAPTVPAGATLRVDGQSVTFGSGYNPAGTTRLNGGTFALNGSPNVLANLTHTSGALTGSADITVSGAWSWSGGQLQQTAAGTTATALSGMTLSGGPTLDGRRLINPAGQTFTYATVNGGLNFSNGAVLQNDGTFDSQADNALQWTGSGAIGALENSGTYRKSGGTTGVSTLSITVTNTGAIQAQTGTLQWNRNLTSTGTVTAASGATLLFADGTHSLNPAPTVPAGATLRVDGQSVTFGSGYNPAGTTRLNGGTFALNGSPNVLANLTHTSGALTGSADITVSGAWSWSGGTLGQSAAGTSATIAGTMSLSNGVTLDGRRLVNPAGKSLTFTNAGTMSFSNGAVVENSGTLDLQADAGLAWTGSGQVGVLQNLGLVTKSAGAVTSTVSVDVQNQGTIDVAAATLRFARSFTQTAGSVRLVGGSLDVSSPFDVQGGSLVGSGSVQGTVTVSGGTIAPGLSPGSFTIPGNYLQSGTGSYAVELGGLTPLTQHDRIDLTTPGGAATLGGVLDVTLTGGFTPVLGNSFTIMTYLSHTGTFATVNAPDLGPTLTWNLAYNATSLVLTVAPVANPDLGLTMTDAPDPVPVGQPLTYTLTVTNTGTATATSTTLSDPLPAGVSFTSATATVGTCGQTAGTVSCNLGDLAQSATATVTIVVTPDASAVPSITNTASVDTTATDPLPANNSASATTTIAPTADLSVTVGDSPDPVASSGTLVYTVGVANAGPNAASSISMTNTLPAGVTFQSATGTGWACSQAAGIVTCTRAALAVGAAPDITITVTAPGNGGPITDNASVTAAEFDPAAPNTASATTTVTAAADLTITKGDAPDPVDAAATLTYTLSVSNAGPSTANSVSVTDTLPAGVTFVSAAGTGWTCNNAFPIVTCTRSTLAVAVAPPITITVTAPPSGGSITNNASVTASEFDPTTPNTASATTTVTPIADLSITKTDSPDPANMSSTLTYTVTVSNAGPSPASPLTMTDTLPAGVTFVSATGASWTCNQAAGVVTCTLPFLADATAPAITIVVTTPATPGLITNSATIAATAADPVPGNNSVTADTSIAAAAADMSIVKTDTPDPVNAGANLTYALAVSNGGPDPANSVSVVDTLPAGVTFVSASGTGWTCNNAAGVVTCTRATLAVGAAPAITIVVTAPAAGGSISNTATVGAAEGDGNAANNTSTVTTTVTSVANLAITKTDGFTTYVPGSLLTYNIVVSNAGPAGVTGATVTDTFDATRVESVSWVCSVTTGGACGVASGTGNISTTADLPSGGSVTYFATVILFATATGNLVNTATVAAPAGVTDPTPGNNSATDSNTPTIVTDVSIVKTASAPTVAATANFSYTLAVSNAGPSQSGTVTVTDPLPSGAVYQSASGTGWTCSQASGTVTCTRSSLTVGAAPAITINVRAPNSAATLTNTATVATANDPTPGNNTSTVVVTVTAAADLRVTKTASVSSILDDSNLTYTVSVRNAGPSTATNVVMTDNLPGDATLVSAAGPGWTCSQSLGGTGTVTCTRPSLGITTAPAITIVVHVYTYGKGGTVCNTASADSAESDPTPANDSSQACVEVVQGGSCNSVQDLLAEVEIGSIAQTQKLQMVRILLTAISASNTGQGKVVAQRLAIFMKQVSAAEARGAVDSETADSLDACAASLRRQYVTGAGSRSANRR